MGGYPALLAVIAEEASREIAAVRAAAEAERARLLAEAQRTAGALREERLARARREVDAARAAALDAAAVERDRTVFLERRLLLNALRDAVAGRLPASGDPALVARLLPELLADAGDGPFTVVCDPGDEEAVARALPPGAAGRAAVVAAPARRGGLELVAGRRVLDDTLASRLERAWTALEAEAAARLFGGG